MRTGIVVAAMLLATVPVLPAAACSPARGYRVPTSLELAAAADSIVIVAVVGEKAGKDPYDRSVLTKPLALLKGRTIPASVEIEQAIVTTDPKLVFRSDLRALREPNPGVELGGCVRYTFLPRSKVLLFLKRDRTGKLVPYRATFSRDAEDVDGPGSLWVKAVREYVAIAALPPHRRKRAMLARIAALRSSGSRDDAAIARDIAIELSGKRLPPFD